MDCPGVLFKASNSLHWTRLLWFAELQVQSNFCFCLCSRESEPGRLEVKTPAFIQPSVYVKWHPVPVTVKGLVFYPLVALSQ